LPITVKGPSATPRRVNREQMRLDRATFLRPIAHRGLHDRRRGRIENTAPAFLAAIDRNYGIECDLQAAADGTPMVFHDETLDRLVAATGNIAALSPASLARLRYKEADTPILRFAQLLDLVGGRVPLLVEVKVNRRGAPPPSFFDRIARLARAYRGPIALMSFDGNAVAGFSRLAPTVPRGLVVGSHRLPASWWATPSAASKARILDRRLGSGLPGLAFFAVDVRMLRHARAWMSRHAPELALYTWTIRAPRERRAAQAWADAPIFEGYEA
jgi:glycerophosphoryl diester phosphodiesterase